LFAHPFPSNDSKHVPFEWLVKVAASIADYARVKGYPLHIMADGEVLAVPAGPVSWSAVLQYLARVQPTGKRHLIQVIGNQPAQTSVAAIFPWPDPAALEALLTLAHRRANVLAVVIDPATFPAGGESANDFAVQLQVSGIETRVVNFGDDWTIQLSEQGNSVRRPV
jgi:hypothetical protein